MEKVAQTSLPREFSCGPIPAQPVRISQRTSQSAQSVSQPAQVSETPLRRSLRYSSRSAAHKQRISPVSTLEKAGSAQKDCGIGSSTASTTEHGKRSSSWTAKDDETLITVRAQGLNWSQMAPKYFPSKTPDACRKRHGRLMERQNAEQLDGAKGDILAQAYMDSRHEIWNIMASRMGENWQVVEQMCMAKGLKNLNQEFRAAKRSKPSHPHGPADSGIRLYNEEEFLTSDSQLLLTQKAYDDNDSDSGISDSSSVVNPEIQNSALNNQDPGNIVALNSSCHFNRQVLNDVPGDIDMVAPVGGAVSSPSSSRENESSACSLSPVTSSSTALNSIEAIDERKEHILNRLMTKFHEMFDASSGISSRGDREPSSSKSASPASSQSRGSGQTRETKKKRKSDEIEEENNDDHDDEPNKRPIHPNKRKNSGPSGKRKFACPFFKHDPQMYQVRTCQGPGWESVHRIKEHLYRRHAQPPHCLRCNRVFSKEAEVREHSNKPEGCKIGMNLPPEGLDKDQWEKLKSRKSVFQAENEEKKWRDVYLILFPNTVPSEIPSPYYDSEDVPEKAESSMSTTQQKSQFEEYLDQELPRIVRSKFESAIEQAWERIDEMLNDRIESIVRTCSESAYKTLLQNLQCTAAFPISTFPPMDMFQGFQSSETKGSDSIGSLPDGLEPYAGSFESTPDPWSSLRTPYPSFTTSGQDSTAYLDTPNANPSHTNDEVIIEPPNTVGDSGHQWI